MHFTLRNSRALAFTLVEILIVVLIIGVIAAIAIPKFVGATDNARDTSVQTTLQYVRGQIELFKMQHNGMPPQVSVMWNILQTQTGTTETASASPTGTAFGPYIKGTPTNPWNGMTSVSSIVQDTQSGWYYTANSTYYEFRIRNTDGTINVSY
jgi:general secretion pathway protein G